MNVPKISVVIPCYNAQNFIAEAIGSILNQTYHDFELIVIDDGSSDASIEIVRDLAVLDKRIKFYQNITNRGLGYTRAKGVSIAQGTYIAWLDADDIALLDRLELQSQFLDNNPQVGVVGGYLEFFNSEGSLYIRKYFEDDASLRKNIFRQAPCPMPAQMHRAEVFSKVGNFDDLRICEDAEMLFRTGELFEFANIPQVMVKYRQVSSSVTAKNLKRMELQTIRLRFKYSKTASYKMNFLDYVYNIIQLLTVWMPYRWRTKLFEVIRKK